MASDYRLLVTLDKETRSRLAAAAWRAGVSRAEFVRRALGKALARERQVNFNAGIREKSDASIAD